MVFRRRPEKPPLLSFQRILVPLAGNEADDAALRLATLLLSGTSGEASLLQVIEVPFDRQLDAEDSAAVSFSDEVLGRAETFLKSHEVQSRTGVVQARAAGAGMSDVLMALTEGDNRNALAAQIGKHLFGIPRVIAKINDPVRAEAYRSLGLETICRTTLLADALVLAALEGAEATDGKVLPPTAEPIQGAPTPGTQAHEIARAAALEEEGVEPEEGEPRDGEPEAARVGTVRDPGAES